MTGAAPPDPPPLVNIANGLTTVRIVLIPVMAAMLAASHGHHAGWRIAACVAFCAASLTDLYDGRLARSRNLVTPFGQVADPIADKALIGTALISLSWLRLLPWWVTVLILAREIGVTLLRFWVIRHGVIPASRGGKLKTLLQVPAIAWYLLPLPHALAVLGPWIMAAAVVVTLVTGADYVLRALTLRRTSPRAVARRAARAQERDARRGAPGPAGAPAKEPLPTGPQPEDRVAAAGPENAPAAPLVEGDWP